MENNFPRYVLKTNIQGELFPVHHYEDHKFISLSEAERTAEWLRRKYQERLKEIGKHAILVVVGEGVLVADIYKKIEGVKDAQSEVKIEIYPVPPDWKDTVVDRRVRMQELSLCKGCEFAEQKDFWRRFNKSSEKTKFFHFWFSHMYSTFPILVKASEDEVRIPSMLMYQSAGRGIVAAWQGATIWTFTNGKCVKRESYGCDNTLPFKGCKEVVSTGKDVMEGKESLSEVEPLCWIADHGLMGFPPEVQKKFADIFSEHMPRPLPI